MAALDALLRHLVVNLRPRNRPDEPEALGAGVPRRPPLGRLAATAPAMPVPGPEHLDARSDTAG